MRAKKFLYKDQGIRQQGSYEMAFSPEMLALFQLKYAAYKNPSPEYRKRVCEIFGFIIMMAMKYLPPKQRKIFYSVWVRSGGKMKDGILEYSRKTGENHITNYYNYYKAVQNVKTVLTKVGYNSFISGYLTEGANENEDVNVLS
jgi:hypothetical protein